MKKNKFILLAFFIITIGVVIYFFNTSKGGNIDNVNESITKSEVYSEEDIKLAMDIVKEKFERDNKGCTLTDLWYDDNLNNPLVEEWAKQYNADEAIVLFSNFDVDSSGGDGSLNPNTTYTDWKWVLVRNKSDEKWVLKTWGF